jgi:hypothetical protein
MLHKKQTLSVQQNKLERLPLEFFSDFLTYAGKAKSTPIVGLGTLRCSARVGSSLTHKH